MPTIYGEVIEHIEQRYRGTITEAVAKCRHDNPGVDITHINGREVLGWCEVCGCPLFKRSHYNVDSEGVVWCKSHDTQTQEKKAAKRAKPTQNL